MAAHDLKPKQGDKICPITLTKANPKFTWVVGGKEYAFCCPPCVDEFVKAAKEHPDEIKEPRDYVRK
jgi:YHS domain-containing protein